MAGGWARDGAVSEQIEATVADEVARARSRLPQGEGLMRCEECDERIPEARRRAVPGVRRCINCQTEHDQRHGAVVFPFIRQERVLTQKDDNAQGQEIDPE